MSTMTTIRIPLEQDVARIYQRASRVEKEKIQALLSLWLREFGNPPESLPSLMDEISENARARGLTPEILDSLLADE